MFSNVVMYSTNFAPSSLYMERSFSKGHFAALTIAIRTEGYRARLLCAPLAGWVPWEGDLRAIGEEVGERAPSTNWQRSKSRIGVGWDGESRPIFKMGGGREGGQTRKRKQKLSLFYLVCQLPPSLPPIRLLLLQSGSFTL